MAFNPFLYTIAIRRTRDPSGLEKPEGAHKRVAEVPQRFRNYFSHYPDKKSSIAEGMDHFSKETNRFSMRRYMFATNVDCGDINWCETLDRSTGWYDWALTERV